MTACVLLFDHRFLRGPDGSVHSQTSFGYGVLSQRYLGVFDNLTIVGRLDETAGNGDAKTAIAGDGVVLESVGTWNGLRGLVRPAARTARAVWRLKGADVVVITVQPGVLGIIGGMVARVRGIPYAVELIGDVQEVFTTAGTGLRHRIGARVAGAVVRFTVRGAGAVAYVTERELQRRYPARRGVVTSAYSSIQLGPESFVDAVPPARIGQAVRLVGIGSLERTYKGFHVLLDALAALDAEPDPPAWTLTLVGGGRELGSLREQAARLGLAGKVTFTGHVYGPAEVRAHLDAADLFVLSSLTEGLPRVLIEAMARGKAAVATNVGGVSELVEPAAMVPAGDASALRVALRGAVEDPDWRQVQAERNLPIARRYALERLTAVRDGFYRTLSGDPRTARSR